MIKIRPSPFAILTRLVDQPFYIQVIFRALDLGILSSKRLMALVKIGPLLMMIYSRFMM
jgi:hypothetical protein